MLSRQSSPLYSRKSIKVCLFRLHTNRKYRKKYYSQCDSYLSAILYTHLFVFFFIIAYVPLQYFFPAAIYFSKKEKKNSMLFLQSLIIHPFVQKNKNKFMAKLTNDSHQAWKNHKFIMWILAKLSPVSLPHLN